MGRYDDILIFLYGTSPAGPFTYMENSPVSYKPTGFIGGAGHGCIFTAGSENYWKAATNSISVRHMFERRVSFYPSGFDKDGYLFTNTYLGDYPMFLPGGKEQIAGEYQPGWMLLSYGKKVSVSSSLEGYPAENIVDEDARTAWVAQSNRDMEWAQVDLQRLSSIHAIQVNFADYNFNVHAPHDPVVYQYYIEGSTNGKDWTRLVDEEKNLQDAPHKLHTLNVPAKVQYLKICNTKDMEGSFSLFDLRVFGQGGGKVPAEVTGFQASRDNNDKRIYRFTWNPQENVTGYILRWGTQKEKLTHSMVVYENQYEARYFNRDSEYYFSMSAFNENGVGK